MDTTAPGNHDARLPFAALQLLAPPVRLVSAALWKVMKQRDVMQYGMVEEFVSSACETVPALLTFRHQGKLALGLRARLILELCCTQPDAKVVAAHLERIRVPTLPSTSSSPALKKDVKIIKTVENFQAFVRSILNDTEKRERFFKETFHVEYGPKFDEELEKLLWEFLIRLEQLLPIPNLAQTVSWLSGAPSVLEECAQAATQPQLLKLILQHQRCLGHLETPASLLPNMGDSILTSLSLPPSGRVASNQTTSSAEELHNTKPRDATPAIEPVIGMISNADVPIMVSEGKREILPHTPSSSEDGEREKLTRSKFTSIKDREKHKEREANEEQEELKEDWRNLFRMGGKKRKQTETKESDTDEEGNLSFVFSPVKKRKNMKELIVKDKVGLGELLKYLNQTDLRTIHLPDDPFLCTAYASCLISQPRIVLTKLPISLEKITENEKSPGKKGQDCKEMLARQRNNHSNPGRPSLDDKENHPLSVSFSLSRQNNRGTSSLNGDMNDYVGDSEDEAKKNFRGRLFLKRYIKTKHDTYVPTLREFWKPQATQRYLSSKSKQR